MKSNKLQTHNLSFKANQALFHTLLILICSLSIKNESFAENFVEVGETLETNIVDVPVTFYDMFKQSWVAFNKSSEKFEVKFNIEINGKTKEVILEPHEIRSDNYFANTMDFSGSTSETDLVAFFKANYEDGDFIRATFVETELGFRTIKGLVKDDGKFYSFGTSAYLNGVMVVEEMSKGKIAELMAACGVESVPETAAVKESSNQAVSDNSFSAKESTSEILTKTLRVVELATEADYEFNLKSLEMGKSANSRILEIINEVDAIYQEFLDIKVEVVSQNTWESMGDSDPYPIDYVDPSQAPEGTSGAQIVKKLISLRKLYPGYFGDDGYDAVLLFAGEIFEEDDRIAAVEAEAAGDESKGGVVGISYESTMCREFSNQKYSYAVVRAETSSRAFTDSYLAVLAVHELAHILGASHHGEDQEVDPADEPACDEVDTSNYFMCPYVDTEIALNDFKFADISVRRINNFLDGRDCLAAIQVPVDISEEPEYVEPEVTTPEPEVTETEEPSLPCVDTDGDGWGWDGFKSCRVESKEVPVTVSNEETTEEPVVEEEETVQETTETNTEETTTLLCIDTDGDGWGWNGITSCEVTEENSGDNAIVQSICIDKDGDGWGWNGFASCQV